MCHSRVPLEPQEPLLRCHSASCPVRMFRFLWLPHPLQQIPFWGSLMSTTVSQTAAGVQQQQPAHPNGGSPEALGTGAFSTLRIIQSTPPETAFRRNPSFLSFSWFAVRYTLALQYCAEWEAERQALEEWYQESKALLPILSQPWLEAELQATGHCLSATHYISRNPSKVLAARMSKFPSTSTNAHLSTVDFLRWILPEFEATEAASPPRSSHPNPSSAPPLSQASSCWKA